MSRRLPSGVKVKRRKKEVNVSFAYRLAFLNPRLALVEWGFGEASIGITAGRGIEGAGETERREENEDLREWLMTLGGFMGSAIEVGVPGAEGTGEATELASRAARADR